MGVSMLMSVFNYETRKFDHYEVPGTKASLGVVFGRTRQPKGFISNLGQAPEALALKLPSTAKKIGSSGIPKGIIAAEHTQLAGIGDGLMPTNPLLVAGLAIVAWELVKKFYFRK